MDKYYKKYYGRYHTITEDNDEEEIVIEDIPVTDVLQEIGDNLGYPFTYSGTNGSFSVSDNVEVSVRIVNNEVQRIFTRILKNPARFDCTKNTATVDNLSVELQTCVLIIKDVRQKLMWRVIQDD